MAASEEVGALPSPAARVARDAQERVLMHGLSADSASALLIPSPRIHEASVSMNPNAAFCPSCAEGSTAHLEHDQHEHAGVLSAVLHQ